MRTVNQFFRHLKLLIVTTPQVKLLAFCSLDRNGAMNEFLLSEEKSESIISYPLDNQPCKCCYEEVKKGFRKIPLLTSLHFLLEIDRGQNYFPNFPNFSKELFARFFWQCLSGP
jgi:hypothetical protein